MDHAPTGNSGFLTRTITTTECSWLDHPLKKGTTVFRYTGPTYGCITPAGVAVLLEPREFPFVEIPRNAIQWD